MFFWCYMGQLIRINKEEVQLTNKYIKELVENFEYNIVESPV